MSVWLDGLLWEQEAVGSNPTIPTNFKIMVDILVKRWYNSICKLVIPLFNKKPYKNALAKTEDWFPYKAPIYSGWWCLD